MRKEDRDNKEDEGRKRKIAHFMSDLEFSEMSEGIFGVKPTAMSEDEIRITKEAGENALVYKVQNSKPVVLLKKIDRR